MGIRVYSWFFYLCARLISSSCHVIIRVYCRVVVVTHKQDYFCGASITDKRHAMHDVRCCDTSAPNRAICTRISLLFFASGKQHSDTPCPTPAYHRHISEQQWSVFQASPAAIFNTQDSTLRSPTRVHVSCFCLRVGIRQQALRRRQKIRYTTQVPLFFLEIIKIKRNHVISSWLIKDYYLHRSSKQRRADVVVGINKINFAIKINPDTYVDE